MLMISCVHHGSETPFTKLDEHLEMKEGSIQAPTLYLGEKLNNTVLSNCVVAWDMSSRKYVQSAVQNIQEYLEALPSRKTLTKKTHSPCAGGYKPELDDNQEVDLIMANFFQSQIGILRWCMELSAYLCLSLEGHLNIVFRVFSYLVHHQSVRVVFNPTYPVVDMCALIKMLIQCLTQSALPCTTIIMGKLYLGSGLSNKTFLGKHFVLELLSQHGQHTSNRVAFLLERQCGIKHFICSLEITILVQGRSKDQHNIQMHVVLLVVYISYYFLCLYGGVRITNNLASWS
jgi:hypothetical protein